MNVGRLGITDEHAALHEAARGWTTRHCAPAVAREYLDAGMPTDARPPFWDDLVAMGWLGLHLPAELGGEGYGLLELGVVLEELGRACAPGPFLPTVAASALLHALDGPADVIRALAAGSSLGAVGRDRDAVPGATTADWLIVPAGDGEAESWTLLDRRDPTVRVDARPSVDETRVVARVTGGESVATLSDPDGVGHRLLALLWSAEALGVATWCLETAASYAAVREQFGRPIGQFQAVKHRCADMLLALELARAPVWHALRDPDSLSTAVAASLASEAAARCAKDCIQVLGGVGFTWEHDAHLYLRRAITTRAFVGAPSSWRAATFDLARSGARRDLGVDLPEAADALRGDVRAFLADLTAQPKSTWRVALADGGYIAPHWPRPWGREASALEQLVIDDEMRAAHVRRPHLQVGAWVLPTLIAHGSPDLQQRFIPPTLRGELSWCQLFSEPGAGSDLAGLSTKAVRVDGGWSISGQKVWTTFAADVEWGMCLARTDSSTPRHDGITCFLVDMRSEGIEVRPLRELTGQALFNEVFLSDVFVPDELVCGPVNGGWAAARTTLANERVSMADGSSFGLGIEMILGSVDRGDAVVVDRVGALLAESLALNVLGLRMTTRALGGMSAAQPGPESSVRKLLGVEHDQRVQELGLELLGTAATADDGEASSWVYGFLANRCLTIAGGTSEIQRNVIAERLLGLPRDP
jgi:alkylation response protein AidB-like acyl-CoA dehydrogenase